MKTTKQSGFITVLEAMLILGTMAAGAMCIYSGYEIGKASKTVIIQTTDTTPPSQPLCPTCHTVLNHDGKCTQCGTGM